MLAAVTPRRSSGWRLAGWLGSSLLVGACFGGEFVQGLPCQTDDDCGPELSCTEGLCGGPGQRSLCGNGLIDVGEECDDGNTLDNDACTPDCALPVCGDGFIGPGETCDDGNTLEQDDCTPACRLSVCGDGFLGPGEACDDGNVSADDDCSPACTLSACGDGFLGPGEECDDGNDVDDDTCLSTCVVFSCGDGVVGPGELCDDGNLLEQDDCTPECRPPVCGDGFLGPGEDCDDANLVETDGCRTDCIDAPDAPELELVAAQTKQFEFSWAPALGASYYQLLERASPGEEFVQVGGDIEGESVSLTVALHLRVNASYVLRACDDVGTCTESEVVDVDGTLAEAIGYFKASNTGYEDQFGTSLALSADGNTLVVGAPFEDSAAMGIDGDGDDDSATDAGAVYVFVRDGMDSWSEQAYVKASNTGAGDQFGVGVALSADGDTLAVGAYLEDSDATGIDGEDNDSALSAGAVYVFVRDGMDSWSEQAYVKASNADSGAHFGWRTALSADGDTLAVGAKQKAGFGAAYVFARDDMGSWSQQAQVDATNPGAGDEFGTSVALSADGDTLAVGARYEDGAAKGIDGAADDLAANAGAAYVFVRDGQTWPQQGVYVKASNTDPGDWFGTSVALSDNGDTLAVGAHHEHSNATGIGGNEADNSVLYAGAAYVFVRDVMGSWSQQAYVKASNTDPEDRFGYGVALSADGDTLAVGAPWEDSGAGGIDGDQLSAYEQKSGAAYVFVHDGVTWSQRAYVKASNCFRDREFGRAVALSADGESLAVAAPLEDTYGTGVNGNQSVVDPDDKDTGAAYLY